MTLTENVWRWATAVCHPPGWWRRETEGGGCCVAHAVGDVAEVQRELKAVHVEFMVSPSLCRNPVFLSLCLSVPQQSPPDTQPCNPCSPNHAATMAKANELYILMTLN